MKQYEEAKLDIVEFDADDIITSSEPFAGDEENEIPVIW